MQNKQVKILAVGDVVGSAGVGCITQKLRKVKLAEKADVVIVNAENAAPSNGLDQRSAELILDSGADVLTGGNHTLKRRDLYDYLNDNEYVLRPLNYQAACPGKGYAELILPGAMRLLVVNVAGQLFMDTPESPFSATERLLNEKKYDICVVDIHAEATSEKAAFARYFDGRVQCVFGTHTHVQTADETLLPKGGAFITDIGMCGAEDSILGIKPENVINKFLTRDYCPFESPGGNTVLCGAVFTVDLTTLCTTEIKRIRY